MEGVLAFKIMITDKQIEEATRNYSNALDKQQILSFAWRDFKAGAHWAIEEFLKDLWHDASEKPKQHKMIVAITGGKDSLTNFDAEVYNFPFSMSKGDWVDLVDQDGIVKWCYIDDLLPKKGGGK